MRAEWRSQVPAQPCQAVDWTVCDLSSQKAGPTFVIARKSFIAFSRRESFRLCIVLRILFI